MFNKILEQITGSIPFLSKIIPHEMIDIQFEIVPYMFNTKGIVINNGTNVIAAGNFSNEVLGEFIWKIKTTITNISEGDIFLERFQILYPLTNIYVDGYNYGRRYLKKGASFSFILRIHHETVIKVCEKKKLMHRFPFFLDCIKIQLDWSYPWLCFRLRRSIIACLNKDEQYYLK